jgi:hypothetical protein
MGALSRMTLQLALHDQASLMRRERGKSEHLHDELEAMHEAFHLKAHTLITEQGEMIRLNAN